MTTRVVDPVAHQTYLIGKSFVDKWGRDDVEKGIDYLEQTLEHDSEYARAHAGLATAYVYSAAIGGGWRAPGDVVEKARAAANRALELDESLAEAHVALASVSVFFDWDLAAWRARNSSVLSSSTPSLADARILYVALLQKLGGRHAEILDHLDLALQTDPINPWARLYIIWEHFRAEEMDKVQEEYDQMMDLHPETIFEAMGLNTLSFVPMKEGRMDEAVAMRERAVELTERRQPYMLMSLGTAYESAGRRADVMRILNELAALAEKRYVSPAIFAVLHASMGNVDEAFERLEQAYETHCSYLFTFLHASSFPTLLSDPRWDDLVERVGFPTPAS